MLYVQYCQPERRNSIKQYIHVPSKGVKLNVNWHTILFIINTTSAVEFCLAVNLLVVILGSNRAKATIDDMNTNIEENSNVIAEWKRCQLCQHLISGKLIITWDPS
eukprot:GHVR01114122.1.p1 GENE.GHVR01114122.1~~GHVR01114122.1.p1  ORF type:complete len:106 (-),score=1.74 GHVR01114122.1:2018-2335(-)